jgi:hypothetical protein
MKRDERPEDRPPTATTIITPGAVGVSETARLLESVAVFVRSYVVLSEAQLTTVALWNLHCHAFAASDYTPYLFVTSAERESGKSRLKEVCELLVPKPISTMNVSTAALFRLAGEKPMPPTFLIDELDQIFAPKSERAELRGLLNAGFRRGEYAIRMVGEGSKMEPHRFEVYCPKLLAGKRDVQLGDTLESRCIVIELKRKTRAEKIERFRRREVLGAADSLQTWAVDWGGRFVDRLEAARPNLPDELDDREQDVWEPLISIADVAGGDWPERARRAAVFLSAQHSDDAQSLGVRLLADCRETLNGHESISTKQLIELLCLIDESPWGEKWWDSYKGEQKKGAAANLAWHLRRYGIHSKKIRFEDGPLQGYEREGFEDAWTRYLPSSPPLNRNNRNNPHEQSDYDPFEGRNNAPAVPAQQQPPKPHEHSDVPDVPAEKPQEGQGELDLGTAPLDEIRRRAEAGLL